MILDLGIRRKSIKYFVSLRNERDVKLKEKQRTRYRFSKLTQLVNSGIEFSPYRRKEREEEVVEYSFQLGKTDPLLFSA